MLKILSFSRKQSHHQSDDGDNDRSKRSTQSQSIISFLMCNSFVNTEGPMNVSSDISDL